MASNAQTGTRRGQPTPGDEEASAELRLGEFQNVPTLSLSEAKLIIDTVIEKRKESKKPFQQTEYVSPLS